MKFNNQKLGDICEVKGGKRLPKGEALIEEENNHPYLRIVDFVNGGIDESNLKYVPESVYEKIKRYTVSENDIFLSIVGTIGLCGTIPSYLDGANLTENAVKIYPKNGVKLNPLFLMYYLLSDVGQHQIDIRTVGSTQPKLAITRIRDIPVPKLNIHTQNKIVEILHSFTNKIENNNKIISNLEELAQTLFKRWFVDFEFPNENGEPYKASGGKMVESELGMIPEGWRVLEVRDVSRTSSGNLSKEDNLAYINYLDTSNLTRNIIENIKYIDISKEKAPSRAKRKVQQNDILYSTVRPNQHHYGIIKKPLKNMIASTGFAILRNNSMYSSDLIYLWLTQEGVTNSLQAIAEQRTSAYPSINVNDILSRKLILPSPLDIENFNELIDRQNEIIWEKQLENKKLSELRDTLLPKLLSGEIELPETMEVTDDVPVS